jgi:acetyl esterase/lipase
MALHYHSAAQLSSTLRHKVNGRNAAWMFTVAAMLAHAACSSQPAAGPAEQSPVLARAYLDVPYASTSPAQRLDLYLPSTGNGPFPLVIWIHGGGWSGGTRTLDDLSPQRQLVLKGYAVATVDYRLSGVARYPAAVQDVKASIRFLRANATRYALAPDRVALWGSSAGAHLAALVGTTPEVTAFDDASLGNAAQSVRVQAVVSWFAPTDLLQMDADGAAQGCPVYNGTGHDSALSPEGIWLGARPSAVPALARQASPVTWLSSDDPPFLVQHGGRDCTVPTNQGARLRDGLRTVETDSTSIQWTLFPVDGHGGTSFNASANVNVVATFLDIWLRAN